MPLQEIDEELDETFFDKRATLDAFLESVAELQAEDEHDRKELEELRAKVASERGKRERKVDELQTESKAVEDIDEKIASIDKQVDSFNSVAIAEQLRKRIADLQRERQDAEIKTEQHRSRIRQNEETVAKYAGEVEEFGRLATLRALLEMDSLEVEAV